MKTFKITALLLSCALLATSLSACAKTQAAEPVSITLMHGWGASAQDHVGMRAIYDDFAAQNPDIILQYDSSPDISVVIEKANNMLALDKMPDIISTNGHASFLENAKVKQTALDLAPYIKEDASFAENISQNVLDAWTDDSGAVYTLPDAQEVIGYWYNEDIFRLAGVTDTGDENGKVVLPRTWEQFWQACDKIAAISHSTNAAPMLMQLDQMRILLGARLAANDNSSREFMQGKNALCDADDVTQAVAELSRAATYYSGEPLSERDVRQMFFDGQSAIYFNGVWANTELGQTSNGQNIKYANFPSDTAQSICYISPASGYVLSSTNSPAETQACLRFLKYMISEPVQKRIVTQTRQAPSNPKITTQWIEQEVPILGEALGICYNSDVSILSLYIILDAKDSATLDIAMEQLLRGDISPDAFYPILTGAEQKA